MNSLSSPFETPCAGDLNGCSIVSNMSLSTSLKSMASPSVCPKSSSYESDLDEDEDVFNDDSGEDIQGIC